MKKIKLLMPLGIATLAGAMMPLVSCGGKGNSDQDSIAKINKIFQRTSTTGSYGWAMCSEPKTYKIGDIVEFTFAWKDYKDAVAAEDIDEEFDIFDGEDGWEIILGKREEDPASISENAKVFEKQAKFDNSNCHFYLDGNEIEDFKYEQFDDGRFYPLEPWGVNEDTSVITGSLKISDIVDVISKESQVSCEMQFVIH